MLLTLAKKLIACPSISPKEGGALDLLEKTLKPYGFKGERLLFSDQDTPDVDNLYAKLDKGGKHFCFAGHTDVVPPGEIGDWTVHPFEPEVIDGMLYGRGAVDMKGAIACFVTAVAEFLEERGDNFKGTISLMITGDEEAFAINGTRKMLGWLADEGEKIDHCIVGEPTNPEKLSDMIKIGRRGSVSFKLSVFGTQGHVAYPHLADNPTTYLINILHTLTNHVFDNGTAHFDPTNLEVTTIDVGNPADNVIPAKARTEFNIRFNDLHTSESLIEWVVQVCDKVVREDVKAYYELTPRVTGESFLTEPGYLSDLVAGAVEAVTGKRPVLSTTGGTSDARFIKDFCPVVECGLINQTAHKIDERVAVKDLEGLTAIYKRVLEDYFS
jgi:succinyl-diaminopimelate desuccinylase